MCLWLSNGRIGAHLRGPAAAEYRPKRNLRRQTPPHYDAAPLGRVRCSTLLDRNSVDVTRTNRGEKPEHLGYQWHQVSEAI